LLGKTGSAVNGLARSRFERYSGSLVASSTFYLIDSSLRHYFTSFTIQKENL
jgi:hypothetical protein